MELQIPAVFAVLFGTLGLGLGVTSVVAGALERKAWPGVPASVSGGALAGVCLALVIFGVAAGL